MSGRVVVVGSSNTDMILQVQRIPRPGETVLGGKFSMAAGGKGANQAVAAARLKAQVWLVARVGTDLFGNQAVEGFRREGIQLDFVVRDQEAGSGVALIFVAADGENSIGVASGANERLSPEDVTAARTAIESAEVLLLQLEVPLETVSAAAQMAAERNVPVILNPAPARDLPDELLKTVSVLTPNETEAELLTGVEVTDETSARQAADRLLARGVKTVIVTMGARGALVRSAEICELVPTLQVEPVDTTAAGDVFNGALAVGLAEKKPLLEAVRFANAAAALSVTKLGAQPSAPTRQAVEQLLNEHR